MKYPYWKLDRVILITLFGGGGVNYGADYDNYAMRYQYVLCILVFPFVILYEGVLDYCFQYSYLTK